MTQWTHRTMAVPLAQVELADRLSSTIAGLSGAGMWVIRLTDGEQEWRGASGSIWTKFAELLADPAKCFEAAQQVPALADVTLAQIEALLSAAVISDGTVTEEGEDGELVTLTLAWQEIFARAGLTLIVEEEDA